MVKQKEKKYEFDAVLKNAGRGGVYAEFPYNVEEEFGVKGQVKITAAIDGLVYRGSLANMGLGCHILGVLKSIRKKIGKEVGDTVHVVLERDTKERLVEVPKELQQLLKANTKAQTFYDSLSYTNRKEYARWITDAKRKETKQNRLNQTLEKLLAGKKNPTEK